MASLLCDAWGVVTGSRYLDPEYRLGGSFYYRHKARFVALPPACAQALFSVVIHESRTRGYLTPHGEAGPDSWIYLVHPFGAQVYMVVWAENKKL